MIQKFVDRYMERKDWLAEKFKVAFPESYGEVVKSVVEILADEDDYGNMDPNRIQKVGWGDYQGENLYVIGEQGYTGDPRWVVKVAYGSCSGCDTLQRIKLDREYNWDTNSCVTTKQNIADLLTLALHIVQNIKEV